MQHTQFQTDAQNRMAFNIAMRLAKAGVADPAYAATRIMEDASYRPGLVEHLIRARIRLHRNAKAIDAKPKTQKGRVSPATARRRNIRRAAKAIQKGTGCTEREATRTAEKLVAEALSAPSLREKIRQHIDRTSKRQATAEATTGTAKPTQTAD